MAGKYSRKLVSVNHQSSQGSPSETRARGRETEGLLFAESTPFVGEVNPRVKSSVDSLACQTC